MVAEKSTPFQVRSMAFERELQHSIASLTRILSLQKLEEYARYKAEAEVSLTSLVQKEKELEGMRSSATHLNIAEQISRVALELFSSTEERLLAENSALDANTNITRHIEVASGKLKSLEIGIQRLQESRSKLFARSLENTNAYSSRLRGVEDLRNTIKELQANLNMAGHADTKTSFLIIRGKINMNLWRIDNNRFSEFFVASDIKNNNEKIKKLIEMKNDFILRKNEITKKELQQLFQDIQENNNQILLTLNQEIELLSAQLERETKRESIIYEESNRANALLLDNSRLVSMGHSIAADITRLFIVETVQELEYRGREIQAKFQNMHQIADGEESALIAVGAKEELLLLKSAHESLEAIREAVFSKAGIVNTLKSKIQSKAVAEKGGERLKNIAEKQAELGREIVLLAQDEQKNTIDSVKQMISKTISRITTAGIFAVLVGMAFGYWISHSILNPLNFILNSLRQQTVRAKESARLAENVASGDLSCRNVPTPPIRIDNIPHDEFGSALHEIVAMSRAQFTLDNVFSDMTSSLRSHRDDEEERDKMKTALFDLNRILRNEQNRPDMPELALSFIMDYLGASVGILYFFDDSSQELFPIAGYAIASPERMQKRIRLGEGIAGEAGQQQKYIVLDSLPPDYLCVTSALVTSMPANVLAVPLMQNDTLVGVMEMGSFIKPLEYGMLFLNQALDDLAVTLVIDRSRRTVDKLLEQTQCQSEELRAQQEELKQTNEILLERAVSLAGIKQ